MALLTLPARFAKSVSKLFKDELSRSWESRTHLRDTLMGIWLFSYPVFDSAIAKFSSVAIAEEEFEK